MPLINLVIVLLWLAYCSGLSIPTSPWTERSKTS